MVRPESALRRLMRETGKLLQAYGFEGAEPTWARAGEGGVATVGRTRVTRAWTAGQHELSFGLTLDVTPTGWWEFRNWRETREGKPPIPIEQAAGPGLITDFGIPARLWSLRVDSTQQGQHARQADIDAIRAELPKRVHTCARAALRLAEPGRYLEELLARPDPGIGTREAIVVLLADHGPGPQLDDAIEHLRAGYAHRDAPAYAEEVILAYVNSRVALV
ncbi:hypothetical protein [Nocardia sp. NPDC127526]|uniref:hypothetical protein n=1 Tax=Nocardia sp. NPDC127526 TaxID=3345393 RepID=UPI003636B43D